MSGQSSSRFPRSIGAQVSAFSVRRRVWESPFCPLDATAGTPRRGLCLGVSSSSATYQSSHPGSLGSVALIIQKAQVSQPQGETI